MVEITKRRKRRIAKNDERLRRKALPRWTPPPPEDLVGGAGVREPRRPRPGLPADAVQLPEPESQYLDLAR